MGCGGGVCQQGGGARAKQRRHRRSGAYRRELVQDVPPLDHFLRAQLPRLLLHFQLGLAVAHHGLDVAQPLHLLAAHLAVGTGELAVELGSEGGQAGVSGPEQLLELLRRVPARHFAVHNSLEWP
jgi:hypothetical protein